MCVILTLTCDSMCVKAVWNQSGRDGQWHRLTANCREILADVYFSAAMVAPFDLFRRETDGSVLWIGLAVSVNEAEEKIAAAMAQVQAEYIIASVRTGHQRTISPPKSE